MTTGKSPKILFVDDDEDFEFLIRQKFRKRLKSGDFRFEFAPNGKEALAKLQEDDEIHLVFTDLNMPVMDGLTFLDNIRDWDRKLTKSVVVSAYGEMANIRKAMNYGAFDFLVKPIDFNDLEITLQKSLEEIRQLEEGMEARESLEKALLEKAAAEESERIRQRFFANITHEFRTPLTLILGPLDQLLEDPEAENVKDGLQVIRRNAGQLLHLINQLLDFARIDAGKMHLSLVRDDVAGFAKSICEGFKVLGKQKGIEVIFSQGEGDFTADFDPDKLTSLLNNLLSNALKFTEKGGKIEMEVIRQEDGLEISVTDTGIGINADVLPFIFDRFYRVREEFAEAKTGTGIGLAYARELARLHGGSLSADSRAGEGSRFELRLPLRIVQDPDAKVPALAHDEENRFEANPLDMEVIPKMPAPRVKAVSEEEERTVVLVVEDNHEIREYIRQVLSPEFFILEAGNGQDGLELARRDFPDVIVSDVMMPVMDGFAMCRELKDSDHTSHIPVIMLTAKTGTDARVEGLHEGADDYIEKPFNHHELKARIRNLVDSRKLLAERYRREALSTPEEMDVESLESQFLRQVRKVLEENLDNEYFSVEELAEKVFMSRTQLHRKMKALTGVSAGKFMRSYRLNTAQELLKKHAGNIAEIAYRVGFSSPSYFTKCFREEFGISPKEVK